MLKTGYLQGRYNVFENFMLKIKLYTTKLS